MLAASSGIYLFGGLWLAAVKSLGFKALMVQGVLPFLPLDLVKLVVATGVSGRLLGRVRRVFQV